MKILNTDNFVSERMKIRPVTNTELDQIKQEINANKYELTDETTKTSKGNILYRIKALKDIPSMNVKKGDLGGWIESYDNLDQKGDCWVVDYAYVYGNAKVHGNAKVYGDALVCGDALVYGYAIIRGNAIVYGNAQVYDNAKVYDKAKVYGNTLVYENAAVYGNAEVYSNAKIYGSARVYGFSKVYNNAEVYGNAKVDNCHVHNVAKVDYIVKDKEIC